MLFLRKILGGSCVNLCSELGDTEMRPEGPKHEARRAEAGWCLWGGGSQPPPQQLGVWGNAVSSPSPLLILVLFERHRTSLETAIV